MGLPGAGVLAGVCALKHALEATIPESKRIVTTLVIRPSNPHLRPQRVANLGSVLIQVLLEPYDAKYRTLVDSRKAQGFGSDLATNSLTLRYAVYISGKRR